jgi:predicted enzyme related to lactoylglutathione lyase
LCDRFREQAFYESRTLFAGINRQEEQWKIEAQPEMDYVMFDVEPGPGGGFPKADGETYKKGDVIVYISTDDIEATLAKVEELGGKTLLPKTEIPNMGWFAFFSDPTGNRVGLYTGMDA